MSETLTVNELLDRHHQGVSKHERIPNFTELAAQNRVPHIAIITCADPRCIPENYFHLNTSEVIVLRTPGGSAVSALSGLLALDTLIGITDIIVVKHTDCGATMFRDDNVKQKLKERAPDRVAEIDDMNFYMITTSLEDKVKEDLAYLRGNTLMEQKLRDRITGYVYDLETGKLNPVE